MRRSRTVGRSARPAWVTRAEAAFLARVPVEEIDRWIASGRLGTCRAGANVFVDLAGPEEPAPEDPPIEARSVRAARGRSDRALPAPASVPGRDRRPAGTRGRRVFTRPAVVMSVVAGATAIALLVQQFTLFGRDDDGLTADVAAPIVTPATSTPVTPPAGQDPFASPFGAPGTGDKSGGVLVKPPGVVRHGDAVIAATTVVNQSDDRWLPPSEITFIARDGTGRVIARTTATVSLGPGRTKAVVAPDLGVDSTAISAIEAHIDPAPLRARGYQPPSVTVSRAVVTDAGTVIEGTLSVGPGADGQRRLACIVFDSQEPAAVSTTTIDPSRAQNGSLPFWLIAQPATSGPYRVSCSVMRSSATAPRRRDPPP